MTRFMLRLCLLAVVATWLPAFAQIARVGAQREEANVTTGTVVSTSSLTMVVRAEDGEYLLFVMDRDSVRPANIAPGARVRVSWRPDEEGQHVARSVQVISEPAARGDVASQSTEPVPPEIRRRERQIERQVRRYRGGVRGGVGLDPEIITAGVHAKLGPFFHRDVWFRPNLEMGFGEVTTLFALNLEAVYRLPITPRQARWSAYVGAGPGLNFIDRDFEAAQRGEREINFSDFDYETSLNILAGVEFRSGMFLELKGTAYSRPNVKLLVGYSF